MVPIGVFALACTAGSDRIPAAGRGFDTVETFLLAEVLGRALERTTTQARAAAAGDGRDALDRMVDLLETRVEALEAGDPCLPGLHFVHQECAADDPPPSCDAGGSKEPIVVPPCHTDTRASGELFNYRVDEWTVELRYSPTEVATLRTEKACEQDGREYFRFCREVSAWTPPGYPEPLVIQ